MEPVLVLALSWVAGRQADPAPTLVADIPLDRVEVEGNRIGQELFVDNLAVLALALMLTSVVGILVDMPVDRTAAEGNLVDSALALMLVVDTLDIRMPAEDNPVDRKAVVGISVDRALVEDNLADQELADRKLADRKLAGRKLAVPELAADIRTD